MNVFFAFEFFLFSLSLSLSLSLSSFLPSTSLSCLVFYETSKDVVSMF